MRGHCAQWVNALIRLTSLTNFSSSFVSFSRISSSFSGSDNLTNGLADSWEHTVVFKKKIFFVMKNCRNLSWNILLAKKNCLSWPKFPRRSTLEPKKVDTTLFAGTYVPNKRMRMELCTVAEWATPAPNNYPGPRIDQTNSAVVSFSDICCANLVCSISARSIQKAVRKKTSGLHTWKQNILGGHSFYLSDGTILKSKQLGRPQVKKALKS